MVALSWLNAETLKRVPTSLFGRLVRWSAHNVLSQDYSTTQKAPKPPQDKEDRLRSKQNMRGLKVPEWTTHNYTSANSLSHSLYIFSMRTYMQHKTYIYMGRVPSCISLPPLLKSFLPCSTMVHSCSHAILMKQLPGNQTLQLGTTDRSTKQIS